MFNAYKNHKSGLQKNGVIDNAKTEQVNNTNKLVFHCQLAHGSPVLPISEFVNIQQMYQVIANAFKIPESDILFCTLNTNKIDMTKLLGGQIALDDFIFVHIKGQVKEVEVVKTNESLGLTITDNGAGYAFIKKIKENSTISRIPHIFIGDHIERINNISTISKTHFEVAKLLKEIPLKQTFTLRLVEPVRNGFSALNPRNSYHNNKQQKVPIINGRNETIRFKNNNVISVEEKHDCKTEIAIESINNHMENYFGVSDVELAIQIWETSEDKKNSIEFMEAINDSDLEDFKFSEEFIFELWGIITDARAGRLKKQKACF